MPPNFLTDYSYPLKLSVEKMGTTDLRIANKHKRELLDLFERYLPLCVERYKLIDIDKEKVISFLEQVFKRDYFWNFRDMGKYHKKVKKGIVYRTSSLTFYQNDSQFKDLLAEKNISTIIDLRADREIQENGYSLLDKYDIEYIHCPFDPWSQSIAFQNTYNTGSNAEIAYHFFMLECKNSLKKAIEGILHATNGVVIHCHAGKDRTGIVVALLAMFIGTPKEDALLDYIASEMDTNPDLLDIVYQIVSQQGGIEQYFHNAGIDNHQLKAKKKAMEDLKTELKSIDDDCTF